MGVPGAPTVLQEGILAVQDPCSTKQLEIISYRGRRGLLAGRGRPLWRSIRDRFRPRCRHRRRQRQSPHAQESPASRYPRWQGRLLRMAAG